MVIKRATIHSQSTGINLTNALAIQIETRDTDKGRIVVRLRLKAQILGAFIVVWGSSFQSRTTERRKEL